MFVFVRITKREVSLLEDFDFDDGITLFDLLNYTHTINQLLNIANKHLTPLLQINKHHIYLVHFQSQEQSMA
jgi:hypothetical protein